ncbi:MAG TPA: glutamate formimidoyltransferase [Acidobacteriaceae bacterium]|jgi:glutamate formiminotransferase|nr:glutamate formimidoyltransferase [Acidobacteriaceae bacterium]
MPSHVNPNAVIECVPNFSEGTDEAKVASIVAAMRVDGVRLLDWSLDVAHNRSVVTIAGSPSGVFESAVRGVGRAAQLIDLTRQKGEHPRIGAADVVPFVPVSGVSLAECAMMARQAGLEIWRRYGVPVYFYEAAAARPDRVNLEDVRRGQFEGLLETAHRDASRRPDVGGPEIHPTAGASAVGARSFLIAYNIYLDSPKTQAQAGGGLPLAAQADIAAARAVARAIRASTGGLQGVKAIGVSVNGRAQVSMNITDFHTTAMSRVHDKVRELARTHGAVAAEGEVIGLIPLEAYEPQAEWLREIPNFDPEAKVLERRLEQPLPWPAG